MAVVIRTRRRTEPGRDPETVLAWFVGEGDVLAGGAKVVSVQREAVGRTVRIATDAPQVATLHHNQPVRVVRQAT